MIPADRLLKAWDRGTGKDWIPDAEFRFAVGYPDAVLGVYEDFGRMMRPIAYEAKRDEGFVWIKLAQKPERFVWVRVGPREHAAPNSSVEPVDDEDRAAVPLNQVRAIADALFPREPEPALKDVVERMDKISRQLDTLIRQGARVPA